MASMASQPNRASYADQRQHLRSLAGRRILQRTHLARYRLRDFPGSDFTPGDGECVSSENKTSRCAVWISQSATCLHAKTGRLGLYILDGAPKSTLEGIS